MDVDLYANPNLVDQWDATDWKIWFDRNKDVLDRSEVIDYLVDQGWEIH